MVDITPTLYFDQLQKTDLTRVVADSGDLTHFFALIQNGGNPMVGRENVTQTLFMEGYRPLSVNALLSCHPHKRSKLKRQHAELMIGEAMAQGIYKAAGKRRVSIRCEGWPRGRTSDPDNLLKVLLDSAVKAGLLLDDNAKWCEIGGVEIVRAKDWRTVITFEDLE